MKPQLFSDRFDRLVRLQSYEKVMDWCTAQCKMLLICAKTIVKESCNLVWRRRKKTFWLSGDFLVKYFHHAFSCY